MAYADEQTNAHALQFVRRGNVALRAREMHALRVARRRELLQLEHLRAPRLRKNPPVLAEGVSIFGVSTNTRCVASLGFMRCSRATLAEPVVTATEPDRHAIRRWELEIAMDRSHHVEHDFVGGVAAMHAPVDFTHREGAPVAAAIVELAIVRLDPVLEFEAQQASLALVRRHVRDGADAEKGVRRACRRAGCAGALRVVAVGLQGFAGHDRGDDNRRRRGLSGSVVCRGTGGVIVRMMVYGEPSPSR
ncbi:MAG: hypothetical protein WDO56_19100 [Gammaproteobacteria bacterium]